MNIDKKALKGILDCMHEEADARDKRTLAIRDIVKAAAKKGFDGKALRKVFVRQRMDAEKRQHDDDLIDAYEHALGAKGRAMAAVEAGATLEAAAEANGVDRATVARARAVAKQGENATVANQPSNATHDPETGEITETPGLDTSAGGEGTAVNEAAPALAAVQSCGGAGSPSAEEADGPLRVGAVRIGAASSPEVAPGPHDALTQEGDGLDIPPFLRRKQEGGGLSLPDRREAVND